jgi:hypothetical protein
VASPLNARQFLTAECQHCDRQISFVRGEGWVNREAPLTGDDSMWRETCEDPRETAGFTAEHEPLIRN